MAPSCELTPSSQLGRPADPAPSSAIADVLVRGPRRGRADPAQARAAGEAEGRAAGHGRRAHRGRARGRARSPAALDGDRWRCSARDAAERRARRGRAGGALAEKILARRARGRARARLDVVAGALRRLVERRRVTCVVNPDDLELVRELRRPAAVRARRDRALGGQSDRRIAPRRRDRAHRRGRDRRRASTRSSTRARRDPRAALAHDELPMSD